ncbi:putative methyltransferase-domain-containing protein [Scenedesmus sp. NREL 46B-D3]|nr:putative methyltransferase-domain-containing protein [Scenedesmus sp. NREL 46B-D3]
MSGQEADQPCKKQKITASSGRSSQDDELKRFYRSWAWKREHRPDKERFHRPYKHTMVLPGSEVSITLSIRQKKFGPEGFASTVWDSAIVAAKYVEKWPELFAGKRCCDLSAGCGLVAVVMAKLGASAAATDLAPNLPLLIDNCKDNGVPDVAVVEHRWGCELQGDLSEPFDVIVACDVMYVDELVPDLVQSLLQLSFTGSTILIAHGRNRPAEPAFKLAAARHFAFELVPDDELDEVYQCSDVDVLRLRRLPAKSPPSQSEGAVAGPGIN